jgi:hypothetical protein
MTGHASATCLNRMKHSSHSSAAKLIVGSQVLGKLGKASRRTLSVDVRYSSFALHVFCPLRIREREFCAERLLGNVLPLTPSASINSWNRGRWADHGAVESRTPDVGVKKLCALEIGLPKTWARRTAESIVRKMVTLGRTRDFPSCLRTWLALNS